MNKNWGDRADKDLFFTILSVKNIGVISGAEWSIIGNTMRVMGYGFTNEGCRQHFQGLRRAQNKAAANLPHHPLNSSGLDPTLDPITRRPGPGRGRPRKKPIPNNAADKSTTNITPPTGPDSTFNSTHQQSSTHTPHDHSPHLPSQHTHHHGLPGTIPPQGYSQPPRPIAGGPDYAILAAQYSSEPSQRPTPPSTRDGPSEEATAIPAHAATESDDAPGEDVDEPPAKRQRADEPRAEVDELLDDVVIRNVQFFEPGETPIITEHDKNTSSLPHIDNDIGGTTSALDSDQIEEESDDDIEEDDEDAGLNQHNDFAAGHGDGNAHGVDQESDHDAEEAVLSLVGASGVRPSGEISNHSTPGWESPAEASFGGS